MEKKFNIIIASNASTDEITDSIADLFSVGIVLNKELADGFQLQDVLAAIQVEPTVREVVNDFPLFISQFKDLNGVTAISAVKAAKERTLSEYGSIGKIGSFIYDALIKVAGTFSFIESVVVQGAQELEGWKSLLATLETE